MTVRGLSSVSHPNDHSQLIGTVAYLLGVLRVLLEIIEDLPNHRIREDHLNLRVSHRVRCPLRISFPRALRVENDSTSYTLYGARDKILCNVSRDG